MSRMGSIFQKAFIGVALALSVTLIVFSLVRVPRDRIVPEQTAQPELSGNPPPKVDRPADVGNVVGEEFLRKVERPVAVPASGLVSLEDATFSAAYDELYDRRDAYYGREIELSGYVMAQEGLAPGAFLVGRNMMWCCAADKYFIGFLAFADGNAPAEGECIHVRGVIEGATYTNPENGKTFVVPAIRVASLEAAKDVSPVVYRN
jgi:hypothetical protein